MQIKFRYTDQEYHELRKLNHLIGLPRWKSYGMAFLCLLPSFFLTLATHSMIFILSAAALVLFALGLTILAAIKDKKITDEHDHVIRMNGFSKHEIRSLTESETRWDYYEEFRETPDGFWFKRLDRHSLVPKRAVAESDLDEVRSLGSIVSSHPTTGSDDSESDLDQSEPVSVYFRFFSEPNVNEIYQFRYHSDDLIKFVSDPLTIIDTSREVAADLDTPPKSTKRQRFFGCFWLLVFVAFLIYNFFSSTRSELTGFSSGQIPIVLIGILIVAIALPFTLLLLVKRWLRFRAKSYQTRVPTSTNRMRLLTEGWAIGNPKSCTFFDWRDIESFYQNKFCFGLRTVNDLVQVIPKRIFPDEQACQSFIETAIGLRREHLRSFATKTTAVETGNPYQPPIS